MKSIQTVVILMLALIPSLSFADCVTENLSGTFQNQVGDKFKLEHLDCNSIIVTDLQTGGTYTSNTDQFTLLPKSSGMGPALSAWYGVGSISSRLSVENRDGKVQVTGIVFRAQLPVKQKDPFPMIIEVKMYFQIDKTSGQDVAFINLDSIKAVASRDSSALQQTFIKGFNFGISLMLDRCGVGYYETLYSVR